MTPTREQLWDLRLRDQNAVPGPIWVDSQCLDCELCREIAPSLFRRNEQEGTSYVFRQPDTEEEKKQAEEAIWGCCVEAIHSNGDSFDWRKIPPLKPYSKLNRFQKWIRQIREDFARGRICFRTHLHTYSYTFRK